MIVTFIYLPFSICSQSLTHHQDRPPSDEEWKRSCPESLQRQPSEWMEVLGLQGRPDKGDFVKSE